LFPGLLLVAEEAAKLGLLGSTSVKEISHSEADALSGHGGVLWGTNAQERAQRPRKYLGWTPTGRSLRDEIAESVRAEGFSLGLLSA
jgi:hypothetical protein